MSVLSDQERARLITATTLGKRSVLATAERILDERQTALKAKAAWDALNDAADALHDENLRQYIAENFSDPGRSTETPRGDEFGLAPDGCPGCGDMETVFACRICGRSDAVGGAS